MANLFPAPTQELWTGASFDRLDVQPLSQDETTGLVSSALGGQLDPDAARYLWKMTQGNPLYLRNIVEREVADGRLLAQGNYWHWTGEPVMAPGLLELIESRIGAVPPQVSDVVDVLAVGEPIGLASLTRIAGVEAVEEADLQLPHRPGNHRRPSGSAPGSPTLRRSTQAAHRADETSSPARTRRRRTRRIRPLR